MSNTKDFIKALANAMKEKLDNVYYDEGSSEEYPQTVITDIRITHPDESTVTAYIDVDHWTTDEPGKAVELEDRCDDLKNHLDKILITTSDFIATIYFETQQLINDPDYELIRKQQNYTANIYYKEG